MKKESVAVLLALCALLGTIGVQTSFYANNSNDQDTSGTLPQLNARQEEGQTTSVEEITNSEKGNTALQTQNDPEVTTQALSQTVTELVMTDEVIGKGAEAKPGKMVTVHYTGTLYPTGEKFDSSKDHGQPFQFKLGKGQVIQGWDQGVAYMKVGGKRVLIIPPNLAYGDQGVDPVIPPNATLKFEVELLDVK